MFAVNRVLAEPVILKLPGHMTVILACTQNITVTWDEELEALTLPQCVITLKEDADVTERKSQWHCNTM